MIGSRSPPASSGSDRSGSGAGRREKDLYSDRAAVPAELVTLLAQVGDDAGKGIGKIRVARYGSPSAQSSRVRRTRPDVLPHRVGEYAEACAGAGWRGARPPNTKLAATPANRTASAAAITNLRHIVDLPVGPVKLMLALLQAVGLNALCRTFRGFAFR